MIYTREMLDHDFSEEAYNYIEAGIVSKNEVAADVKECLADYELEDEDIVSDYIENLMAAIESEVRA